LGARGHVERLVIAGGELAVRAGLGLDGVVSEAGDGLVFAQIGLRGTSRSSNDLPSSSPALDAAGGAAAVRSRIGIATRLRMPFYLIPGDLLLLSPLYFVSPETYTGMAVTAGNGGVIPWQAGWATGIGPLPVRARARARCDLLRLRLRQHDDRGRCDTGFGAARRRLQVDPLRAADPRISPLPRVRHPAELGRLVPTLRRRRRAEAHDRHWPPGAPGVKLDTIYSIGIRVLFDWRRYF
jgi:hypothetical protein